ncbi:hypothetical protein ACX80R_02205 [Paeniglutamicibacter antarcticus]
MHFVEEDEESLGVRTYGFARAGISWRQLSKAGNGIITSALKGMAQITFPDKVWDYRGGRFVADNCSLRNHTRDDRAVLSSPVLGLGAPCDPVPGHPERMPGLIGLQLLLYLVREKLPSGVEQEGGRGRSNHMLFYTEDADHALVHYVKHLRENPSTIFHVLFKISAFTQVLSHPRRSLTAQRFQKPGSCHCRASRKGTCKSTWPTTHAATPLTQSLCTAPRGSAGNTAVVVLQPAPRSLLLAHLRKRCRFRAGEASEQPEQLLGDVRGVKTVTGGASMLSPKNREEAGAAFIEFFHDP